MGTRWFLCCIAEGGYVEGAFVMFVCRFFYYFIKILFFIHFFRLS